MTKTIKTLSIATASALALTLGACGSSVEDDTTIAQSTQTQMERTEVLAATTPEFTRSEFTLKNVLDAGVIGSDGDEFDNVDNAVIRDGRLVGITFGETDLPMVPFDKVSLTDGDLFDEIDIALPMTEDYYDEAMDDFDVRELTFTDREMGTNIIGTEVRVAGYDEPVDLENIVFKKNGEIAFYVIDPGLGAEEVRVEPYKVAGILDDGVFDLEDDVDALTEDAYDYENMDVDDYSVDRK